MSEQIPFSDLVDINPKTPVRGRIAPFVGMEDVSEDGRILHIRKRSTLDIPSGLSAFRDSDILFAKITPCMENGKGAYVEGLSGEVGLGSTEFHVLRARRGADPRYVFHWTRAAWFRLAAEAMMTGSAGQRRVPSLFFKRFKVPVFSLAEQRRIAEILDALDGEIECVRQSLQKTELMRHGLLQSSLESIEKDSPSHMLGELSISDGDYGSNSPSVPFRVDLPRYIRITDINEHGALRADSIVSHPSLGAKPYLLENGDLLIARTGFTLGKTYLHARTSGEYLFAGYLVRFRFKSEDVIPRYIFHWTQSDQFARWVNRTFREVGQRNISAAEYARHVILIPPVEWQRQLVGDIYKMDQLTENYQKEKSRLIKLKQGLIENLLSGRVGI